MRTLASLGRVLLDAVAPRRCAACDAVDPAAVCAACAVRLLATPVPKPLRLATGQAFAGFAFEGGAREILHRGKFQGDRAALRRVAELTAQRLELGARGAGADAAMALPLGSRRRRHRGYNQAEDIAAVIAAAGGVPLAGGLARRRETPPQSSRDLAGRRRNIAGAFVWRGAALRGARLWLVDDVLTTGATIEAASAALLEGGARRVDVIVVARVL